MQRLIYDSPELGTNPKGGRQPIIHSSFPENFIKMEEIVTGGGARSSKICLRGSATD